MKRILTEPLVHFVLLGAALFALSSFLSGRDEVGPDAIVVSAGKLDHLSAIFTRTRQRAPSPEELAGLVDDYVREEVAYREGLAYDLDRDDTVIRRRMRQKLEFIAEELAGASDASDEELAAFLADHPDDFRVDPRLALRHVYLDPGRRGEALELDARELLIALDGDPGFDARVAGDRILLEHEYTDLTLADIAGHFGPGFADAIAALEPGAWHGPIGSAYGAHLVRVDERREGRLPALAEIHDKVRREWENVRRLDAIDDFYDDLLEKYDVRIEWPQPDAVRDSSDSGAAGDDS